MLIHPTAVISPSARIAANVEIGPFCVIEDDAVLGAGCKLASHVVIKRGTLVGSGNRCDVGAVLGADPQHLAAGEEVGSIVIGDRNQFREYATVHRAYKPSETTRIGNDNMLMASSHVGHDCKVGNHNILANNVMLAGHVEVADRNYFGGGAAFHQFCRVGSFTMVGGYAAVKRDVPPFVMVDGSTANLVGLNKVGLRRSGMSSEHRSMLMSAYRVAFRSDLSFDDRLDKLKSEFPDEPARQMWQFLEGGTRGFLQDRRTENSKSATKTSKTPTPEKTETAPSSDGEPHILPFRRAA